MLSSRLVGIVLISFLLVGVAALWAWQQSRVDPASPASLPASTEIAATSQAGAVDPRPTPGVNRLAREASP